EPYRTLGPQPRWQWERRQPVERQRVRIGIVGSRAVDVRVVVDRLDAADEGRQIGVLRGRFGRSARHRQSQEDSDPESGAYNMPMVDIAIEGDRVVFQVEG